MSYHVKVYLQDKEPITNEEELTRAVYSAASEGQLKNLQVLLRPSLGKIVKSVVNSHYEGCTSLIIASRKGHTEVVEYLVEKCEAQVNQTGSVQFDGEAIHGAPPLWCAAAAGHIDIVKILIRNGANVNSTTSTNSTPLRGACFDGHFEIVRFLVDNNADIEISNRHGHTVLMISCFKGHLEITKFLIKHGAKVNSTSLKGNTALHDCAESGSVEIMKLLIAHGAKMQKDSYDMLPLMSASVAGHAHVVEYIVLAEQCTNLEACQSLELLGATYVDKKRDHMNALRFWKRAMKVRIQIGGDMLPKQLNTKVAAYGNAAIARNLDELESLFADPEGMRMQALLLREQILGPSHPDTSYYIRFRGAVYADTGNFDRCVTLWKHALNMQLEALEPFNSMTLSSFQSFAELYHYIFKDQSQHKQLNGDFHQIQLTEIFRKAVIELFKGQKILANISEPAKSMEESFLKKHEKFHFDRAMIIIIYLVALLARMEDILKIDVEQSFQVRREIYKLVKMKPKSSKEQTLLHLACTSPRMAGHCPTGPTQHLPSPSVVQLLLEVGADVDVVDADGNTPLHLACLQKTPVQPKIIELLMKNKAHYDRCNYSGKRPWECSSKEIDVVKEVFRGLRYTTLKCLSARAVKINCIPIQPGDIPNELIDFVEIH